MQKSWHAIRKSVLELVYEKRTKPGSQSLKLGNRPLVDVRSIGDEI